MKRRTPAELHVGHHITTAMSTTPLPEFMAYRATHRLGDYSHWVGPSEVLDPWFQMEMRGSPPAGVVNAYDAFLAEEGRQTRRRIDVPDPAYGEGHAELNALIDRILASQNQPTATALLASLQVDLDWIFLRNVYTWNTQGARIQRRLEAAIERVVAAANFATEASTLLYLPTLQPIHVAVQAVSVELMTYLANNPSAIHELRPRQFEELIAAVMESFGFEVELTPETRDGGYDILAVSKSVEGTGLRTSYIVECKKYRADRKVGIEVARQLLYVKGEHQASNAIIATTSDFTSGVYDFAAKRLDFDAKNAAAVVDWCRMAAERARKR